MPNRLARELHANGAETISGVGSALDIEAVRSGLELDLIVSAIAGTASPSLAVSVESAPTETGPWAPCDAFPAVTATGKYSRSFAGLDRWVRARWAITGTTPSFTFLLSGYAHTVYATPAKLTSLGIRAEALENTDKGTIAEGLIAVSDELDGYLGGGYVLPLREWSNDLTLACCKLGVQTILNHRGRQPDGPNDIVDTAARDARKWAMQIKEGTLAPPGIVDSTPDEYDAGAAVYNPEESRGW